MNTAGSFRFVLGNPWVRTLIAIGALALCAFLAYVLRPVLTPLFLAFLVAYILDPVVDVFERRRISRSIAIVFLALAALGTVASVPLYVIPRVIEQAQALSQAASADPEKQSAVSERIAKIADRLPLDRIVKELGWADPNDPNVDAREVIGQHIALETETFARDLLKRLYNKDEPAKSTMTSVVSSIGRGAWGIIARLGNIVLFAFVAVYLLRDFDRIIAAARELVPPRFRDTLFRLVQEIDGQVRSFLRGQALVCLCLGLMYGTGMILSGVPFAVVLAAFGGMASFVPYLGLILTIGPALLLTLLQYGLDVHILGVIATFVIAQSIEGTLLTPKIVGDQVGLNPVWVILAILVFGSALGFLGLLLAVPIAASLKVLVVEAVARYKRSPLFNDSDSATPGPV